MCLCVVSVSIISQGLDLVMWMLLCNRLYLVPTAIPNSNHLFPKDAKLYAMLSVDKKFEEDYEGNNNNKPKHDTFFECATHID